MEQNPLDDQTQFEFEMSGRPEHGVRTTECPAEVLWYQVAAHMLPEEREAAMVAHAAGCGDCGPR